jgi:hypothetical protein
MTEREFIAKTKKQIKNFAGEDRDALFYKIKEHRKDRLNFELKALESTVWKKYGTVSDENLDLIEKAVEEMRGLFKHAGAMREDEIPF